MFSPGHGFLRATLLRVPGRLAILLTALVLSLWCVAGAFRCFWLWRLKTCIAAGKFLPSFKRPLLRALSMNISMQTLHPCCVPVPFRSLQY